MIQREGLLTLAMKRCNVILWVCIVCLAIPATAWAQEEPQSSSQSFLDNPLVIQNSPVSLDVSGTVSFGIKYGLGDGRGLVQQGYSQGLQFNQLLALNLNGDVPVTFPLDGVLSISAQLNSQQADNLQSLAMHFESERLILDLGDFLVGEHAPEFIVPDRRLKGFKGLALLDGLNITGAFARIEGIAESKTFRGNTSTEISLFTDKQIERPWLDQFYLKNLNGLEYFQLPSEFIDGFSKVKFNLNPGIELEVLFENFGLTYLLPSIEEKGSQDLADAMFEIIRTDTDTYLILIREAFDILRARLREAIDKFNRDEELEAEDRKGYPFNEETELELVFLQQLLTLATLDVDDDALPLGSYNRQRFFYLGRRDVDPESLRVEVRQEGSEEFVDINELFDFELELFEDTGLVDLDFPTDFFQNPSNQFRASFNYTSTSGIYILGLSIVKGSDRVFLNGNVLQRDLDYTIDYETGALLLFSQVTKEDLLRIEYEVLRGGLGGFTEYQRNLSQLSAAFNPTPWLAMNVDIFQGADIGGGDDTLRLRTMPNTHTVLGVRALADLSPLQASLVLGYNVNAFPVDKNLRENLPNRINDIETLDYNGKTFVLFAHQNGLAAFDGVRWVGYDTRSGLSGRSVYDIAIHRDWVALATESGITLIRLEGDDPFALIPNWLRFYNQDGLAENRTFGVTFDQDTLWVATVNGFSGVNVDVNQREFEENENWISFKQEDFLELNSEAITEIASLDGLIYLGSERGLQVFDPETETFETDGALMGGQVHDIAIDDDIVFVASDWGLRMLIDGRGSGWVVTNQKVFAVAALDDNTWYASEDGLQSDGPITIPRELRDTNVSALGVQGEGFWVGPVASDAPDYEVSLVRATNTDVDVYNERTTRINGRDLNRFGDISLGENLDLGGIGELRLRYRIGTLDITGAIEGVSRDYTVIGDPSRRDYLRWRVRSDYILLSSINLYAEHIAGLGDPSITDMVGMTWNEGAQLSVNYTEERLSEREETRANFNLTFSNAFLNDALQLRVTLDDQGSNSLRSERRTEDLTLATTIGYQMNDALNFDIDLRSPLRLRTNSDLRGSFELKGRAQWNPQLDFGTLSLSYERENGLRFPRGGDSNEDELEARMNWTSINWNNMIIIPSSDITFAQRTSGGIDQVTSLSASNNVQTRWEDLSLQLRWGRDQAFSSRNQTENIQNAFTARLDYRGIDNLSPGMDWTFNTTELNHASRETKVSTSQQLSGRIGWAPQQDLSVNASVSASFNNADEETSTRYSFLSSTSYRLTEALDFSASLNGHLDEGIRQEEPFGTNGFDLTFGGNWGFAKDWVANFSAGLLWGTDKVEAKNDYLSYILSAQASLTF